MPKIYYAGLVLSGLLLMSGCGSAPQPPLPLPPPPKPIAAAPKPPPPPKPVVMKPVEADACKANDLQYLIGKPKSEIPIPVTPKLRRVVCSTCAVTMDYNPQRQTIVFDEKTGLVTSVKCG